MRRVAAKSWTRARFETKVLCWHRLARSLLPVSSSKVTVTGWRTASSSVNISLSSSDPHLERRNRILRRFFEMSHQGPYISRGRFRVFTTPAEPCSLSRRSGQVEQGETSSWVKFLVRSCPPRFSRTSRSRSLSLFPSFHFPHLASTRFEFTPQLYHSN